MFSSEIKEVIYVAIGCMLAALVLGLVAFVLDIRSDLAVTQNLEIATKQNMESYTTYNKYQDAVLYGEDIIALIREYAGTDTVVYIEELEDETGGTHTFYMDKQSYIDNPAIASLEGLEYGTGNDLTGGIKRNTTYFSYLVYGEYIKDSIVSAKFSGQSNSGFFDDVTAVVVKRVGSGRHSFAQTQAECGCEGEVDIYGPCTAAQIYNNIRTIRGY